MDQSSPPIPANSDNDRVGDQHKLKEFIDRNLILRQLAKKAHLADMVKQKSAADKQHNKDRNV